MKNHRLNHLLVGFFTLSMLAGIIAAVLFLSGGAGATDRYHTVLGAVSDIKYGTQVLFQGFPIGQVESIQPLEKDGKVRFRVEFSVRQGWKIPVGSHLQAGASGLLSTVTLNIHPGEDTDAAGNFLRPGDRVAGRDRTDLFAVFSSLGSEVTALTRGDIRPLLARIGQVVDLVGGLLDKEGRSLAVNLDRIGADLAQRVPLISRDLNRFSQRLDVIGQRVGRIVGPGNEKKVMDLVDNLNAASKDIAQLAGQMKKTRNLLDRVLIDARRVLDDNDENLKKTVRDSRRVVESAARHIDSINRHLENTTRNMDEFSRRIRRNPALLIRGGDPDDVARTQRRGHGGER